MLAAEHGALAPSGRHPQVQDELVKRPRHRQQARARLRGILPLAHLLDQLQERGVAETHGRPAQRPSADDGDARLDGAANERLAAWPVERRGERRDFMEPQQDRIGAVMCREVDAGDRECVRQRWPAPVGPKDGNRHGPAPQDVSPQDVAEDER
jgi:hypothetical protein